MRRRYFQYFYYSLLTVSGVYLIVNVDKTESIFDMSAFHVLIIMFLVFLPGIFFSITNIFIELRMISIKNDEVILTTIDQARKRIKINEIQKFDFLFPDVSVNLNNFLMLFNIYPSDNLSAKLLIFSEGDIVSRLPVYHLSPFYNYVLRKNIRELLVLNKNINLSPDIEDFLSGKSPLRLRDEKWASLSKHNPSPAWWKFLLAIPFIIVFGGLLYVLYFYFFMI